MKKDEIKVLEEYITADGIFNNLIFHYVGGKWTNDKLAICINCGELFIYNQQSLVHINTLKQYVRELKCPKCNAQLNESISYYPETFITREGTIAHFPSINRTSNLPEKVIEVYRL